MPVSSLMLTPELDGWSIRLANGLELEHFRGLFARWRAERRLAVLIGR